MKLVKEKHFWILLLLSFAIRIYAWYMTPVIGRDGLDFINIAKIFSEGNFHDGLEYPFHPLYSLLISLGSISGFGFEHSGRLISLVLSIFTVIALYIIGKRMFNPTVAFIAAFLLAIHPYSTRLSVDVMSDPTYFFFYLTGFGLGYIAINTQKLHLFFFTGIASALAYLTRPEGISILLVTGFCTFIQPIKTFLKLRIADRGSQDYAETKAPIRKPIKSIFFLLIGFLIFSSPYIFYLKSETGTWTLSKKKRLSHITGMNIILDQNGISDPAGQSAIQKPEQIAPSHEERNRPGASSNPQSQTQTFTLEEIALLKEKADKPYIVSFYKLISQYFDSMHYPLLLFLIIGIVNIISKPDNRAPNLYIISYIFIFIFALFFLQKTVGYASYRHLLNIVLVTLFWVAIGINLSYCWIINKGFGLRVMGYGFGLKQETSNSQHETRNSTIINSKSFVIFLCLVSALILPKTLKSHRYDKLNRKEAGLWLKGHHPGNIIMLTDRLIIAYYADTKGIRLPKNIGEYEEIVKFARSKKADYLVVTENIEDNSPGFFDKVINSDLNKLIEFKDKEKKVVIYDVIKNWDDSLLDEWNTDKNK